MNINAKIISLLIFATLTASVLLLKGCGVSDEPQYRACPSGSVLANSTDIITSTPDDTWSWDPLYFPGLPLGSLPIGPVTFKVTDSSGLPKNKVCISFTTDGFWWTDIDYTTQLVGTGVTNRVTAATDAHGVIVLYWSSEPIPYSAPATSAGGSVSKGTDQKGKSQIYALSGALADTFDVDWTVVGCAATTFGPPATCP